MRTKALLVGAIIGAASLVSSQAQVYSVNIVGYINLPIYKGWNLIANQLNNSTGNNIQNLLGASFTQQISVFSYDGANQRYNNANFDPELGWDTDLTVNPGAGFFVYNPNGPQFTLTLVGEVATGTKDIPLYQGWNLISLMVPQDGQLADIGDGSPNFGYVPTAVDSIFTYDGLNQRYNNFNYETDLGWDTTPTVKVGNGFFALRSGTGNKGDFQGNWTRTFNVSN